MPLPQNTNYGDMGQGIDRITDILRQQATPVQGSPLQPQASQLPINLLRAINYSGRSYPGAMSNSNFVQDVQKYQDTEQRGQLAQQEGILKTYEMKLKMGDAQTKALDDKITMFTGDDPEGKALFLQALHEDPEPIDPTNSYQVMTKLAGIKKRTGYESPDLANAKLKEGLQIDLLRSQIGATNALASKRNDPPPGAGFKEANTLRDEFNTMTKDFRSVQDAYSKINNTSSSGAGDMSMLYQYVKLLDPGSVVRESEFASAAAAGSFGERVQGAVKGVVDGGRLSENLRNEFINEATKIYEGQKSGYDRQKATYTDLSQQFGLDPKLVITDYTEVKPSTPTTSGVKFLGFE